MEFELGNTYCGYRFLEIHKRSKDYVEYQVFNTFSQRLEVLRALPQTTNGDPHQAERFLREVHVRARLVHPNILMLFNALDLDGQLVMTTEMVEGTSLADLLKGGRMAPDEAVELFRQALAAAGFAHEQNIVHRDITPDNILITPDGTLKLANFALAKMTASPKLTQVGTVVGNLQYISPEQVIGTDEPDARSDLYSLGAVLYEMLAGRPPFQIQSQFELMNAQVHETPKPPSAWNPEVSEELDAVVLKSLAKDPAERYQTAHDFGQALKRTRMVRGAPVAIRGGAPAEKREAPAAATAAPVFLSPSLQRSSLAWLAYSGAAAVCGALAIVLWLSAR